MHTRYGLSASFIEDAVQMMRAIDRDKISLRLETMHLDLYEMATAHGASLVESLTWAQEIVGQVEAALIVTRSDLHD